MIADPRQRLLMVRDAGCLVGCVGITDQGAGRAYLGMLTVAPGQQAQGIGRRLIDAAEQTAQAQFAAHIMEMTVIVQRTELIAWYLRCGYVLTGETRPFPYGNARFGDPRTSDLEFVVLTRALG